jgi:hypothetical protein
MRESKSSMKLRRFSWRRKGDLRSKAEKQSQRRRRRALKAKKRSPRKKSRCHRKT